MIELRLFKQGVYPRLFRWAQCNHKEPYRRGGSELVIDVTIEARG
jgi:hypothetical protein